MKRTTTFPFSLPTFILIFTLFTAATSCKKSGDATDANAAANPATASGQMTMENIPGSSIQYARQLDPNTQQVILEGYMLDGKKTGQWTQYTAEGDLQSTQHYINDLADGLFLKYGFRNQIDLRANYRQGKLEGSYTLYKYGKVVETRFYKNDKLDGTVRQYDESKFTLKSEAEYKDGVQHGFYRYYDEKGALSLEYQYKNGEKISGGIVNK